MQNMALPEAYSEPPASDAWPVGTQERSERPWRRRRPVVAMAVVASLIVAGGIAEIGGGGKPTRSVPAHKLTAKSSGYSASNPIRVSGPTCHIGCSAIP